MSLWQPIQNSHVIFPQHGFLELLNLNRKAQKKHRHLLYGCFDEQDNLLSEFYVKIRQPKTKSLEFIYNSEKEFFVDQSSKSTEAVLICAVNLPEKEIEVTWFKDSSLITPNSKYQITGSASLKINDVQPDDAGFYRCIAQANPHGILESNPIELVILSPPRFTKTPKRRVSYEKLHVVFECDATGYPEPDIQWMRQGTLMDLTDMHENIDQPFALENKSDLRIRGVMDIDQGYYQCIATNCVGSTHADAKLIILPIESNVDQENIDTSEEANYNEKLTTYIGGAFFTQDVVEEVGLIFGDKIEKIDGLGKPENVQYTMRFERATEIKFQPFNTDIPENHTVWYEIFRNNLLTQKEDHSFIAESDMIATIGDYQTAFIEFIELAPSYEIKIRPFLAKNDALVFYGEYSDYIHVDLPVAKDLPAQPTDVKAEPLSESQIFVTWEAEDINDVNLEGYLIRFSTPESRGEFQIMGQTSITIDGLTSFTTYQIEVFAMGSMYSFSAPTEPIEVTTLAAVPSATPQNIIISQPSREENKVLVTFDLPPQLSRNGILSEVMLTYRNNVTFTKPSQLPKRTIPLVPDQNSYQVTVDDLVTDALYSFKFQVKNQIGWSQPSQEYQITVLKPMPKPWLDIRSNTVQYKAGSDVVKLRILKIPKANAYMIKYGIGKTDLSQLFHVPKEGNYAVFYVKDLSPDQTYSFTITAKNTTSDEEGADYKTKITTAPLSLINQRSAPFNLLAESDSPTSVILTWNDEFYKNPMHSNIITKYIVKVRSSIPGVHKVFTHVCYDERKADNLQSCRVPDLAPFTEYDFYVQASETGQPSLKISTTTQPDVPKHLISNLNVKLLPGMQRIDTNNVADFYRKVLVNWAAPEKPNGEIMSYTLQVKDAISDRVIEAKTLSSNETVVEDLLVGKTYAFSVKYNNQIGSSPWSIRKDMEILFQPSAPVTDVMKTKIQLDASKLTILVIIALLLICVILLICVGYFMLSKCKKQPKQTTTQFIGPNDLTTQTPLLYDGGSYQQKQTVTLSGTIKTLTKHKSPKRGGSLWINQNDSVFNKNLNDFDNFMSEEAYRRRQLSSTILPENNEFYATTSRRNSKQMNQQFNMIPAGTRRIHSDRSGFQGLIPPSNPYGTMRLSKQPNYNSMTMAAPVLSPVQETGKTPSVVGSVRNQDYHSFVYSGTNQYGTISRAQRNHFRQQYRPNFPRTGVSLGMQSKQIITQSKNSLNELPPPPVISKMNILSEMDKKYANFF